MQTKFKKNLMIVLATLFLFAFFVLSALPLTNANADIASGIFNSERYTNVMDDLQKDEKFNTDDYPAVKDDCSLKVIQIAESSAKELFVYVYQPAHDTRDLIATSINISTGTGDELSYWNYGLRLLSTNGVFDKYLVKDFKVSTDEERTYDISNIYRAWNKDIDDATGNDNTISEVGYKIGKCFYSKTDENGNVLYGATETEVVTITDKFVGYLSDWLNGSYIFLAGNNMSKCDSHFLAFSTDHEIDKLLSADVFFETQSFSYTTLSSGLIKYRKYGNKVSRSVSLKYDEKVTIDNGVFDIYKSTYTWSRIQSVSNFLDNETVSDSYKDEISNKQWVLRFYESSSSYKRVLYNLYTKYSRTIVSDVSVLRLEFETDGVCYNLGVVDNKQTGSWFPIGELGEDHDCILWKLLAILIIVGLVCWLLNLVFPWFFPLLGKIIAGMFKGVWYIVSFKWLRDLINHKKRKQSQKVAVVNSSTSGKRKRKKERKNRLPSRR